MSRSFAQRRYLSNFEPHRVPHIVTDVVVVGAGVAGMRAALSAAEHCRVILLCKSDVHHSSTAWAQGGIASAAPDDDSPESHGQDTLRVGGVLADRDVVADVVGRAPELVGELIDWGMQFDVGADEAIARGLEGGHSAARILHSNGDGTGREFVRVLADRVRAHPNIRVFEQCFTIDLLTDQGQAVGVITHHPKFGHQAVWARTTILASGGAGRVYRETTNPAVTTGDGLAMAFRAGATLRDMEMVQFHPTTLYVAGADRMLISEAVRGEGAYLCHRDGTRFMQRYDERGELAPRDVVSRAVHAEMRQLHASNVYLDVRHIGAAAFAERFPTIQRACAAVEIDPGQDLIPVRPAAHYLIGGVVVDRDTRTTIDGLLACGEVASTGLHGANRLASNSLLEGLAFGVRAGQVAAERSGQMSTPRPGSLSHLLPKSPRTSLDLADIKHSLRSVMSRNVAVERSADRLTETLEIIEFWARYTLDKVFDEPFGWETQNLLTVAWAITTSGLQRTESRGVHFRTDYPQADAQWQCHLEMRRTDEGVDLRTQPIDAAVST